MQQWGCCFLRKISSFLFLCVTFISCFPHSLYMRQCRKRRLDVQLSAFHNPAAIGLQSQSVFYKEASSSSRGEKAHGKAKWRERITGHSQSAEEKITGTFRNRESFEAGKDCTEWEGWWAWVPQKQQQQGLHKKKNVQPSPPCIPTLLSACPLVVTPPFHIPPSLQLLWDYCSLKSPTSLSLYRVQIQHLRSPQEENLPVRNESIATRKEQTCSWGCFEVCSNVRNVPSPWCAIEIFLPHRYWWWCSSLLLLA